MGVFDSIPPCNGTTPRSLYVHELNKIIGAVSVRGMVIIQIQVGKEQGKQEKGKKEVLIFLVSEGICFCLCFMVSCIFKVKGN